MEGVYNKDNLFAEFKMQKTNEAKEIAYLIKNLAERIIVS